MPSDPYVRVWHESRTPRHVHLEGDCHCPKEQYEVAMMSAEHWRDVMREVTELRADNERLRRELHGFICEECLKPLGSNVRIY